MLIQLPTISNKIGEYPSVFYYFSYEALLVQGQDLEVLTVAVKCKRLPNWRAIFFNISSYSDLWWLIFSHYPTANFQKLKHFELVWRLVKKVNISFPQQAEFQLLLSAGTGWRNLESEFRFLFFCTIFLIEYGDSYDLEVLRKYLLQGS